ncbi:MAG TPA: hypothetical protein VGW78_06390 [Candidatus Babeliales bacterium]|nr:hypothetical protein [Candidatus Babeliales bacterium]
MSKSNSIVLSILLLCSNAVLLCTEQFLHNQQAFTIKDGKLIVVNPEAHKEYALTMQYDPETGQMIERKGSAIARGAQGIGWIGVPVGIGGAAFSLMHGDVANAAKCGTLAVTSAGIGGLGAKEYTKKELTGAAAYVAVSAVFAAIIGGFVGGITK